MNVKNQLSSQHSIRQGRHLLASIGGLLLLGAAYLCSMATYRADLVSALFPRTILWSVLPYLMSAHLIYRSVRLPVLEQQTMLLINVLAPFLGMVMGFALLQQRYSRGAVLVAVALTAFWFWQIDRRDRRHQKLRLLCLEADAPQRVFEQLGAQQDEVPRHIEFVLWSDEHQPIPPCNGALVAHEPDSDSQVRQLAQIKLRHIRLYSAAFLAETLTGRKSRETLADALWQPDSNPAYDSFKRIADCVVVLILAPVWIPLGALVALGIRLDSPGSVFFTQTRTGLHGKPFRIWKFRTMVRADPLAEARFAQKNDARVTRLGRFLRKSRLDEIPQLVNVLLGHMSLIGPRPEQHAFVEQFAIDIPSYPYRHLVRPGLTGWAQVMQGYAASAGETNVKLQYDLYYVSHYSLTLDLLILAKTIRTVLTGFGAR